MNKKIAKVFMVLLVPIGFLLLSHFGLLNFDGATRSIRCKREDQARNMTWDSQVLDKYIDRNNHNYRTIVLKNKNGVSKKLIILTSDSSGLFDQLEIGDYIKKPSGKIEVEVLKVNSKFTITLDFYCE